MCHELRPSNELKDVTRASEIYGEALGFFRDGELVRQRGLEKLPPL